MTAGALGSHHGRIRQPSTYVAKYFTDIMVIDADGDNAAEVTSTPRLAVRRDGDTGWYWYR